MPPELAVEPVKERRKKPRICVPFHARVEGIDDMGQIFGAETVLDNLSSDGLYLRLMTPIKRGTRLSVMIRLRTAWQTDEYLPDFDLSGDNSRFLIDGVVIRSEKRTGGACGLAIAFNRIRFL